MAEQRIPAGIAGLADRLAQVFAAQQEALCALDAQAGDGDHGLTIARGMAAAREAVAALPPQATDAQRLKEIGYAMLRTMGGASGPIFSTFFIQAAIALQDLDTWDVTSFKQTLARTLDALETLTGTRPGQKTMVDALAAAYRALQEAAVQPATMAEATRLAAEGAARGAADTAAMIATQGRAKYLGERSIGFIDAGAQSVAHMFATIAACY